MDRDNDSNLTFNRIAILKSIHSQKQMKTLFQATIFSMMLVVAMANLTKDNLEETAKNRPVFILAYAPWCGKILR